MLSLPQKIMALWGRRRAIEVTHEYQAAFQNRNLLARDLAMFCNAASPITGANEFERGVEEGKRQVWLHIARVCGLRAEDFVVIADGTNQL